MRILANGILLLIFLNACGIKKTINRANSAFGGQFNPNPVAKHLMENQRNRNVETKPIVYPLKPIVKLDSAAKLKKIAIPTAIPTIDTIPPENARNEADKMLFSAQKKLLAYQRQKTNILRNVVIYNVLALPLLFFWIKSTIENWSFVFIVGGLFGAFLELILLMILLAEISVYLSLNLIFPILPKLSLDRAVTLISKAPKSAPPERRVEYEVRCLKIIAKNLTLFQLKNRIQKIREIAQIDPYSPWLRTLDAIEIEYFGKRTGKETVQKHATNPFLIQLILILVIVFGLKFFL
jgi:hypothetical protein